MKRLILTDLNEVNLEDHLSHPSYIAVRSAQIKVKWFNLPRAVQLRVRPRNDKNAIKYYGIASGLWSVAEFAAHVQLLAVASNDAFKFNIDTRTGVSTFRVMKADLEISATDDGFWKLLGINPEKEWLTQDVYTGRISFYRDSVWLKCANLKDDDNLVDGKTSHVLQVLPLNPPYQLDDVLPFQFEKPLFLPLDSSTNTLSFELVDRDGKSVKTDVVLELLIKHGTL